MHIVCTICSDLLNQAENIYVTKCGHVFHHKCLAQWLERGTKSCPQCRNKVTDKCMFRMYPTVSSEHAGDDAATLQARLDDAQLEARTHHTRHRELQDQLAAVTQDLNKKDESLKAAEKRLVSRESAVAALREQLEYVKLQSRDAQRLRDENDLLKKNMQTLNGLQKVLNATAGEVEETLRDYSDLRTLATFAAALKRALCDSEAKKRSCREQQHAAEQRLAAQRARYEDLQAELRQVQERLSSLERKYSALKHKRKASGDGDARGAKLPRPASPAPEPEPEPEPEPAGSLDNTRGEKDLSLSFESAVNRITASESPYLRLKQSGLALCALRRLAPPPPPHNIKPSEFAMLNSATSIFRRAAEPARAGSGSGAGSGSHDTAFRSPPEPYDGLGGHSRPDAFPAPRAPAPRLCGKHRLRRPHAAGSRDIGQMFAALHDK